MAKGNDNLQFLLVFIGLLGIIFLFGGFTAFQENPSLNNVTAIVGAIVGLALLLFSYFKLK